MSTEYRNTGRIHELDALRGIAALGVVFWHYGAHFDAHPLAGILHPFYNAGFLLVDFFFVLSGYVIGRAYWNRKRQWHLFRNIWARVARLFPLHLLTLLITAALVITLPISANDTDFNQPANDLKHFVLNLLLLNQAGFQDGWSFNTPAWSISTEFIVNVGFLAFISWSLTARLVGTILLAVVGAVLLVLIRPAVLDGQTAFGFLDVNLLRCALGFSAGVFAYLLLERFDGARRLTASPRIADLIGASALIAMTSLMIASGRHPPIRDYLISIAIALSCVIFIPFSATLKVLLCRRWLVFLGDISYSTYLVHYPIQLALYSASMHGLARMDYTSPMLLLGYLVAVICIAAITHKYVELPCQARFLAISANHRAGLSKPSQGAMNVPPE
jgi:Predicted acyltransferases